MGSGDAHEDSEDEKFLVEISDKAGQQGDNLASLSVWAPLGVWDEGNDAYDVDMRLPKVLKAFQSLKEVFDEKFKQMWA